MNIQWIAGVPPTNFTIGREGNPVSLVVDHWMAASFDSALAAFMNPNNPRGRLSAHFLVGTDGRVAQVVPLDDTAHHAGDWNINTRSIGIEHEAGPTLPPSDALYQSSAELHYHLARIYGLTLEVGVTVDPHNKFFNTACPGTLDLKHIVALAKKEGDMTPEEAREIAEKAVAAAGLDPHTIEVLKGKLDGHVHALVPNANQTTVPLFPPVAGATYGGGAADLSSIVWDYPDGTRHEWVNGKEV